jgi:DNA-binding CsgD family transcriptional regulator
VLLEREKELAVLTTALQSAQRGNGGLAVISGPLGSGKSVLLRALAGLAESGQTMVLRSSGSPLERDYAFGVARQLLEPALSVAPDDVRERWLADAAGPARMVFADDPAEGAGERTVPAEQAVLLGLLTLVEQISDEQTLLILVDDLQWIDEASLRWLAQLAMRLERMQVLVVVTVREGELDSARPMVCEITKAPRATLRPRPLSLAGTRALVVTECGQAADEEFVRACQETTGGNPMFLASILLEVSLSGTPPQAGHAQWIRSLRPAQLRTRLIDCMRSQPEPVQAFAKATAILGSRADIEIVGRLADLDSIGSIEAMCTMRRLGLLASGSQPAFLHPVVGDAIDDLMSVQERESLRAVAIRLLHSGCYTAEQVAEQLLTSSSPQGGWAVGVLRTAADIALGAGAPEVAARYLRRALLDTTQDGEDRAELLVDLATVEHEFNPAASIRHISYAISLFTGVRDRAAAVVRITPAMLAIAPAAVRALVPQISAELGELDGLTDTDRVLMLQLEARMRYAGYLDPAELTDMVRRLDEFGSRPSVECSAERELLTILLPAAMFTMRKPHHEIGRLAERILEREPASPVHTQGRLPMLVSALVAAESVARVRPWLQMSLELARSQERVAEQALIRGEQALIATNMGRIAEAKLAAAEALELATPEEFGASFISMLSLAAVALTTQDGDLIAQVLANVEGIFVNPCSVPFIELMHGLAAGIAGDPRTGLEHLLEFGRRLERQGWRNPGLHPWRIVAAEFSQRLGDLPTACELAEEERLRAANWGAPAAYGRALRVLGDLTEGPDGICLLREAVACLEDSINQRELALALLALGNRLGGRDNREAAVLLRRCCELAIECGDICLARRAESQAPSRASAARITLTKGENRVLRLAVDGYTNRAIAELLGVSLRAVEKHLTNGYRKLGVHRRDELADVLGPDQRTLALPTPLVFSATFT